MNKFIKFPLKIQLDTKHTKKKLTDEEIIVDKIKTVQSIPEEVVINFLRSQGTITTLKIDSDEQIT